MANWFNSLKNALAAKYGNQFGEMLVHTGVIGWILSAAAQIGAIAFNDKIPKDKKAYMIPQEAADAAVNILSFYLITRTCKGLANAMVRTGKLLPKSIREHLNINKISHLADKGFEVLKDGKLTPELTKSYEKFYNGVDVIGTTLGAILSCNVVTPLVRNSIATSGQTYYLAKVNERACNKPNPYDNYFCSPTMKSFQLGGNLKV